jgi:hypothetical protein
MQVRGYSLVFTRCYLSSYDLFCIKTPDELNDEVCLPFLSAKVRDLTAGIVYVNPGI